MTIKSFHDYLKKKQNQFDLNVLGPFYAKPHLLLGPHLETSKILGKSWKYFNSNNDRILISKWNILEKYKDCDEEALILLFFQNSVFTEKEANEEQDKERKDSVDV